MKAPKCRVCQAEHRSNEPHKSEGNAIPVPSRHVTVQKAQPRHVTPRQDCERHKARIAELEGQIAVTKLADAKRAKAYRDRRAK